MPDVQAILREASREGPLERLARLGERERYIFMIILQHRSRGLGCRRIGRLLFPRLSPDAAKMRVCRALGRMERLGLPARGIPRGPSQCSPLCTSACVTIIPRLV